MKPSAYIQMRLLPARNRYQTRIPVCTRWRFFWQLVLLSCTATSAGLAYADLSTWVALGSAVATAVSAWIADSDLREKIVRSTSTVREMSKLLSWWTSLSEVEKASTGNISQVKRAGH